jgi:hypothetical protein
LPPPPPPPAPPTPTQVPQPWEKLPPPVIVDVDSDGNDDVVLLTKEPSIKLLARASLKAGTSKKNDFKVRATGGSTHSSTCASV